MNENNYLPNILKDRTSDILKKLYEGKVNKEEIINLLTSIQNSETNLFEKIKNESEDNYRGIYNSVSDAIYILNKNAVFIDINAGAEKMYGYSKEELIGKNPSYVSAPDKNDLNEVTEFHNSAFNGKDQQFKFWGLRKNGEIFPKIVSLFPGKFYGEKVVIAIAKDISQKIKSEEALIKSDEKFRNLLQFAPDAFFQGDEKGRFIECNKAACELTEYTKEELLKMSMTDLFSNQILEGNPLRYDLLLLGKTVKTEREILTKSGKHRFIEMNSKKMDDGTYQSFLRDITERKIFEKNISESEERYRKIVTHLRQSYYEADKRGIITHTNPEFRIFIGYSESELIGTFSFSLIVDEHKHKIANEYKKCLEEKVAYKTSELKVNLNYGSTCWIELLTHFQYDKDGKFLKASNIVRDISERKEVEEALKESESKYKIIAEKATDVVWLIDLEGKSTFVTNSIEQFTGFTKNEYLNQTLEERFTKESFEIAKKILYDELSKYKNKKIEIDYARKFELDYRCKDGNVKTGELLITPYFHKNLLIGLHGVTRDITDRKSAEKALKESEKNFRLLFEYSPFGTYIATPNGDIIDGNGALLKMLGSPSIEATKQINVLTFPPLVKNGYAQLFKQCVDNKKILTLEIPYTSKWGKEIILSSYIIPLINENGIVEKVYTVMEDITERKNIEVSLRESEELFRNLSASTPTAIFVYQNENFVFVNKAVEKLTGYSEGELLKMKFWDVVHPDHKELVRKRGLSRQEGKSIPNSYQFKLLNKNGSESWIDFAASKISWKGNNAALGSAMDITNLKIVEEKLKQSEEKYKIFSELTSDYIYTATLPKQGKAVMDWVGGSFEKIIGCSFDEFLSNGGWTAILHPDDVYVDLMAIEELRNNRRTEIEVRIFNKKREVIWVKCLSSPVWDEAEQRVTSIYGSVKNISEMKNAELALKESKDRYKLISSLTTDYLFTSKEDENGNLTSTWVGGSFEEMTGYTFEEYKKLGGWRATVHPDDLEKDYEAYKKLLKNQKVVLQVRTIHKSGKIVWVESFGSPVWDSKKNRLIGINGAVRDITTEKEALLALQEREEKYKLISEITSDYLFESRRNENDEIKITWTAGSFKKISGYTLEEYIKVGGWNYLLHKDDVELDKAAFNKLNQNKKVTAVVRTYNKSGNIVWVKNTCSPIWDYKKNRLEGIIGSVKDISEEKQNQIIKEVHYNIANAMINIKSIEELFALIRLELNKIIDTTNFVIAFYDENSGMLTADVDNDEKDSFDSWTAEKSISGYLLNTGERLVLDKNQILEMIKNGDIVQVGTLPEIWLGVPLKIRNKAIGVMVVQNYNDSKAFNKIGIELFEVIGNQLSLYLERNKAKEDTLKLSRAIVQSPISILITNINGEIEYVNPMFEKVSQYSFEEVFGKNPRIVKSGNHTKEYYLNIWDTILSGKDWHGELLNKRKNGELFWENVIISPIKNDKGIITHFVSIKEDITEKKIMIEELIASKKQAEVSEKIKTEFLAQMSHEIRSPLNVILNFIGLIKDEVAENLSDDMADSFQSINSASARIIRTVDLILNMTDLQLGSYDLSIEAINVVELLKRIIKEYAQSANKKGLELKLEMEFDELTLTTDEYALMQIVSNLIDNAIKYTEKGKISVSLEKNKANCAIIKVNDTGIGMSENFLPKLFKSFTQEEQGYTRSFDGNGLGMALVKQYCNVISAEISVDSKKSFGSTFTVIVPNIL